MHLRKVFTNGGAGAGDFMTTRVGLLRGGRGGVFSPVDGTADGITETVLPEAFLTVATLALDPIESLLEAILNFDGDEVPPLCPPLCTVEMLSLEADMPLIPPPTPEPISSILIR